MTRRASLRARTGAAIALATAGAFAVATGPSADAADFGPLTGSLSIQAGGNPPKSTPAVVGLPGANLSDSELVGTIDLANANLTALRFGSSLLEFSGAGTTVTNGNAASGQTNATASVNFVQTFTTATPPWLKVTAAVISPPADINVFASLNVTRGGQSVFAQGHSGGASVVQNGLYPPGTYTVQGSIASSAAVIGTHTGRIDASILIAALGDFNGNLVVDGPDLATWRNGFGSLAGTFASGNLDGDGDTDGADFLLWQNQLGTQALPATQATPEPNAAAIMALGLVGAAAHCRTRRSAARRASTSPTR